MKGFKDLQRYP